MAHRLGSMPICTRSSMSAIRLAKYSQDYSPLEGFRWIKVAHKDEEAALEMVRQRQLLEIGKAGLDTGPKRGIARSEVAFALLAGRHSVSPAVRLVGHRLSGEAPEGPSNQPSFDLQITRAP